MFLDTIMTHKLDEVARLKLNRPLAEVRTAAESAAPPLDFIAAVRRPSGAAGDRPRLIAEVKCASPSRGVLVKDFDPLRLAGIYQKNGAAAISVLTDERFFQGRLEYLSQIAALSPRLPVLRKDFILDAYQVYEARAAGADAILLIAACLQPAHLRDLHTLARELGLAPLVEVHNEAEVEAALTCQPVLMGFNNRDLHTFVTRMEVCLRLRALVPSGTTTVAESGIHTRNDVDRLAEAGMDAILVGEALVTAPDVAAAVRNLAA
jgi:indole-3-glycerol phosphate synthase